MRKLVLFAVLGAAAVGAGVAGAKAPLRATADIDVTFADPVLSSLCGQEVDVSIAGTFKATLFFDQSATPIREIDTQPSAPIVYSAPATRASRSQIRCRSSSTPTTRTASHRVRTRRSRLRVWSEA